MSEHIISVDKELCVGCGLCEADCPECNIKLTCGKASVAHQHCIKCGHCVAVCPKGAVSISGFDEDPRAFEENSVDPDALLSAIRFRRSVRKFKAQDIPREAMEKIIEAGRLTPTATNMQDVRYIVLDRKRAEAEENAVKLFRAAKPAANIAYPAFKDMEIRDDFFFFGAPKVIVISAKSEVDGALAAENMALMAEAQGLGVLISGFFTIAAKLSGKVRKTLCLKRGEKVVTTLVLGYPAVKYQRSAQRNAADVRWL